MELKTAIEILEYHQEWRLGKREDMIHEPKKLTEALDIVLSDVKKYRLADVSGSWQDIQEIIEFLQWVLRKVDKGDTPQEIVRMLLLKRTKFDNIEFDSNYR